MAELPTGYLTDAIDLIRQHAFHAGRVDRPAVRAEALRRAGAAPSRARTYDAIRWVLSKLGDHHSFLLTPEQARERTSGGGQSFGLTALLPERVVVDVEPGGAAAQAGVRVGDLVESVDGRPPQGDEVVTLPRPPPCGWAVDLRRDTGGSPPPMLTAVGPVLGDGRALGYRDRDGTTTWYGYRNGAVSLVGQPASPAVGHPARLPHPRPPVAVLTSRLTASAGEGVAMAFAGRPAVRSFGEATAGVPTGNAQLRLPDGAELHLTMGIGVDRLESRPANDHPTAVDNTPPLSARRDMFLDERGAALRVTWHPERDLVVLSVWQHDRCVGTFRMPVQDVPRLSGLLAAALGDWVDQADGTGGGWRPPEGGSGGDLSVQQRLRLSRPVLRLRGLQHRRRRPPPVAPS